MPSASDPGPIIAVFILCVQRGLQMTKTLRRIVPLAATLLVIACFSGVLAQQNPPANTYDLVLRNARIVDGTGSPWYRADLAIRGDTIARIAPSVRESAARTIDVGDFVVAPGF